jgi:predicted RNase H-like nuclease (RuvC/YqgF family)
MEELNQRRSKMTKLSEESGHNRDSLLAANAQLAAIKAQLEKATEQKVNKKMLRVSVVNISGDLTRLTYVKFF